MLLTASTKIFIVDKKDGHRRPDTLASWFNSLRGGTKWDDFEVTTDDAEAKELQNKYMLIAEVVKLMRNMTPEQANKAVGVLRAREDLMDLHEGYA